MEESNRTRYPDVPNMIHILSIFSLSIRKKTAAMRKVNVSVFIKFIFHLDVFLSFFFSFPELKLSFNINLKDLPMVS
jgi:hypothetical protein